MVLYHFQIHVLFIEMSPAEYQIGKQTQSMRGQLSFDCDKNIWRRDFSYLTILCGDQKDRVLLDQYFSLKNYYFVATFQLISIPLFWVNLSFGAKLTSTFLFLQNYEMHFFISRCKKYVISCDLQLFTYKSADFLKSFSSF